MTNVQINKTAIRFTFNDDNGTVRHYIQESDVRPDESHQIPDIITICDGTERFPFSLYYPGEMILCYRDMAFNIITVNRQFI